MTVKVVTRNTENKVLKLDKSYSALLTRLYQNRGITSEQELTRQLKYLKPFNKLLNIDKACERLYQALTKQESVLIIGDFDADGATSSALAVAALRHFGIKQVDYLVPNRFEYGYGLTPAIVEVALAKRPDLIITVDNGIASIDGVAFANKNHIDVLITDHHLPGEQLPEAVAIINPNQIDDESGCGCLAGVGVIFYVMLAFRRYLQDKNYFVDHQSEIPNMAQYLDLVALGTVADVVPLDHNNRILVYQGLQRIRANHVRPGIQALLKIAKREPASLVASDLGFAVGPRLNAAGRLDDMSLGIACLLTDDLEQGLLLADQLDTLNFERRQIERDMQTQAYQIIDKLSLDENQYGLCLYDQTWHEGVIGILAGRIKDKLHRPVIAFAKTNNGYLKGSGRSISAVHLRDLLDEIATQHPEILSKFGGHAMAAGLQIQEQHLAEFNRYFNQVLNNKLTQADIQAIITTDGELNSEEFTLPTALALREAGPWGQQFPEPLFQGEFDIIEQRIVGDKHLKLILKRADVNFSLYAIAFNIDLDSWPNHRCQKILAVYKLDINDYNGYKNLQLLIEHLEPATHEY